MLIVCPISWKWNGRFSYMCCFWMFHVMHWPCKLVSYDYFSRVITELCRLPLLFIYQQCFESEGNNALLQRCVTENLSSCPYLCVCLHFSKYKSFVKIVGINSWLPAHRDMHSFCMGTKKRTKKWVHHMYTICAFHLTHVCLSTGSGFVKSEWDRGALAVWLNREKSGSFAAIGLWWMSNAVQCNSNHLDPSQNVKSPVPHDLFAVWPLKWRTCCISWFPSSAMCSLSQWLPNLL